VKNSQTIEEIHGLGENRPSNLQGFEALVCISLQLPRSQKRSAASVEGLQRQSDSVPFSVRFLIVPKIGCFSTRSMLPRNTSRMTEYREAIIAMAKAWLKIAERAKIKASR
jgi:hypothetical protein